MATDRNANDALRLRRNAQRERAGDNTGSVIVSAPLLNSGSAISLSLAGGGGLANVGGNLAFTALTTKGDLLGYGTGLTRLAVGSNGQILTADSTATTGLKWAAAPATPPVTTKGDVYTFSTVGARLAVGTNGQLLTADSTATTGLKWADPPTTSPLTTKGDVYTFSTVGARLGVGSDGQLLSADSTATTGLKWVAAPVTPPVTTKGDLYTFSSTGARLAVGANNTVLLADSTAATGNKWGFLPVADGSIVSGSSGIRVNPGDGLQVTGGFLTLIATTNGGLAVDGSGVKMQGFRQVSSDPGVPAAADTWFNTTSKTAKIARVTSTGESFVTTLYAPAGPSSYIQNTTTNTAADLSFTLPAGYLGVIGKTLRIRFGGTYTATGSNPTLSISLYLNNPTVGIEGIGASLGTLTSGSFDMNITLTVRTTGASGTFGHSGYGIMAIGTGTQIFATSDTGRTFDSTGTNAISLLFQWGAASASNKVRVETFTIEALN